MKVYSWEKSSESMNGGFSNQPCLITGGCPLVIICHKAPENYSYDK
jgi:hypothetical protein